MFSWGVRPDRRARPWLAPALAAPSMLVTAGGVTSLTYQASPTSEASTITAPASINAGDLLVLVQRARNTSGAPSDVTPTGFTDIPTSLTGTNTRISCKYKIADGTEDSSTITGMNGDNQNAKVLLQYRANIPLTALSASSLIGVITDANPAVQTLTASGGTGIVLGITSASAQTAITTDTISITPDHDINTASSILIVDDYIQASSPADYTWDMGDEGNRNGLVGFYLHNFS